MKDDRGDPCRGMEDDRGDPCRGQLKDKVCVFKHLTVSGTKS